MPHYGVRIKAMGAMGVGLIEAEDEAAAVRSAMEACEFQVEVVAVDDEDVEKFIEHFESDSDWLERGKDAPSMPRIDGPVI